MLVSDQYLRAFSQNVSGLNNSQSERQDEIAGNMLGASLNMAFCAREPGKRLEETQTLTWVCWRQLAIQQLNNSFTERV